ncbi:MAG: metallophosphoesterase [Calditrichaeota bacterium]|nr:metallophosphoesterase [Calditrichota bacterium]
MNRRDFIRNALIAGTALQFPHIWIKNSRADQKLFKLCILQTNDTHSRIDPFPMDGGRNQGLGGIARRASLVNRIRNQNPNTLLLDAGDVLQGTPYFNLFKGKLEYQTMTACGYDVSTLGNHEFDNGVDSLANALQYARFDIVNCNYEFGNTALRPIVKRFVTRQVGPFRVGITGVGISFEDLVSPKNHKGVTYEKPYHILQSVVNYLRKDLSCQLVIVLSHLGYRYDEDRPSDVEMAGEVNGIDWIIGGHTHTFMDAPDTIISKGGHQTGILQVGWAGILLGKTDFLFDNKKLVAFKSESTLIDDTDTGQLAAAEQFS